MLKHIIKTKVERWLQAPDCSITSLLEYIKSKGELRKPQIEAIETYLFLKIIGENKPLWQLFSEGFFCDSSQIDELKISNKTREYFKENITAFALYDFAIKKSNNSFYLPQLKQKIENDCENIEYKNIIKKFFYNVSYPDYLMSLPMGAGKTYLIAAIIYLDLYFAKTEPENKNFAHNFLVLIPSGLKSSIVPSLRTMEEFNPSWVIPEPDASQLKKNLVFDFLDQPKSNTKSNKTQNPNAQKVSQCFPDPFGHVFVVNAEKVILDYLDSGALLKDSEDEKYMQANELRNIIGNLPNLSILIDEVHHSTNSEIKLRHVVNQWSKKGHVTTVLGFSGTPYLSSAEKIKLGSELGSSDTLRVSEITNTVYYYPLKTAIETFLKNPIVKIADKLSHLQIVKHGIEDFNQCYKNVIYADGTIAKVAIYCSTIEMLEEDIYPFLQDELKIDTDEILRFHGGNKNYTITKESELQFKSLDTNLSKKRYILLVGIGKEGWDCKSLTSVILPQKSKSISKNTIIQTTCRCLRQVVKGENESALIWLNVENASILNTALAKEQDTSIEELNNLRRKRGVETIERFSRIEYLKLPKIDFYQLKINYQTIAEATAPDTKNKLKALLEAKNQYKKNYTITTKGLGYLDEGQLSILNATGEQLANYRQWITTISKDSFNTLTSKDLYQYDNQLQRIFKAITLKKEKKLYFNEQYDVYKIASQIRLAFSSKRTLKTEEEVIPKEANLLIIDKLKPIAKHNNLYPTEEISKQILQFDKNPITDKEFDAQKKDKIIQLTQSHKFDEVAQVAQQTISPLIKKKDRSFHVLPYNFDSQFESDFLNKILNFETFINSQLEIYFNGERGITEFVINCFAKRGNYWNKIGRYTTDFLIIKRSKKNAIHKVLIIETKGAGFANDSIFIEKKNFIETRFIQENEQKFGYKKFDFLYLEDNINTTDNLAKVKSKIEDFF